MTQEAEAPHHHVAPQHAAVPKKSGAGSRIGRALLGIVGVLCLVLGVIVLGGLVLAPNQTASVLGDMKVGAQSAVQDASGRAPEVQLGETGPVSLLDVCDGLFYGMASYEDVNQIIPVYAAHNNCGGDVVLAWDVGDRIQIEGDGRSGLFEVVDVRITPKTWATTSDLIGLGGEFALQSCYYGINEMRFLGLEPVTDPSAPPATAPATGAPIEVPEHAPPPDYEPEPTNPGLGG
ncbi:hypothetical protein GCM10011490_27340 [Pseudoclavibacter endophyticus]|uniref:Uncharacterized protein n=1 Tax=Pseudoclavibacter endophyticus TaxID=1778590 RepID=A0A6H9WAI2_9MICO|nr:hypothetical protein [Pseudoclavibacter endophyticus]KAB1646837.1 hypothetical protein F8O04_13980 [Pseudoclavibacter endophyticus]GGA75124.1 hypothetical protein GCM10011490_27340 [Pseudoclavibacter endophyticus]